MSDQSTDQEIQLEFDAWKVTVGVQQHFNDIELKVRNFALTLLVAVLGAAGFALREGAEVSLLGGTTSLATILLVAGLMGWGAFYFVDRIWYHRLLMGAVAHGTEIEERLAARVPGIRLTHAISKSSPYPFRKWQIHSDQKITFFYSAIAILMVLLAVLAHFASASETSQENEGCEMTAELVTCASDTGSFRCDLRDGALRCQVETKP